MNYIKRFALLPFVLIACLSVNAQTSSDENSTGSGETHLAIPGRFSKQDKIVTEDETADSDSTEEAEEDYEQKGFYADPWYKSNISVVFDKYPYHDGPYLTFDNSMSSKEDFFYGGKDKTWRYAVDTSFFYTSNIGFGNTTRFEGYIFKFIGPIAQLDSFFNLTQKASDTDLYKGNVRLGFEIALFQNNFFSIVFTGQWSYYFNLDVPNGLVIGMILKSYPMDPLLLEYRLSLETFTDYDINYAMIDSHLEVGAMIFKGPVEIFGAWNWQYKPLLNSSGHGVEIGTRFHF